MTIKRWVIDAPCNDQYEECAEGEWCEWDDVSAELMKLDGELAALHRRLATALDLLTRAYDADADVFVIRARQVLRG